MWSIPDADLGKLPIGTNALFHKTLGRHDIARFISSVVEEADAVLVAQR